MTGSVYRSGRSTLRSQQAGAVTLAMSLVLLLLITMVSVYTSRSVLQEQKISANDFRARQAFEAAESGLQIALAYLAEPGGNDKDRDGTPDPVFDTDGDGIGNVNLMTFDDNSSVTIALIGAFPNVAVQANGISDDRTASRTIRALASTPDAVPNIPQNPLTTRSSVSITGSATIHNPEGNLTVWSGGDVSLGSNNATATEIADPADPNYPTCMYTPMTCNLTESSNKLSAGLDVMEYDSSISNLTPEALFQNFFGVPTANYRENRTSLEVAAADANNLASNSTNPGVNLGVGEVIWIEGNASLSNVTVGCRAPVSGAGTCAAADLDPSIVIVNGNLATSGITKFYGYVYVIGSLDLSGDTTVTGAMTATGEIINSPNSSTDIWYDSGVLRATRNNGPLAGAPGSWQDW